MEGKKSMNGFDCFHVGSSIETIGLRLEKACGLQQNRSSLNFRESGKMNTNSIETSFFESRAKEIESNQRGKMCSGLVLSPNKEILSSSNIELPASHFAGIVTEFKGDCTKQGIMAKEVNKAMGNCDCCLFGEKSEIDKVGEVCRRVGELLKAKYGPDENSKFWDWTGISNFLICYKDLERTLHEQKVDVYDEEEIAEEWHRCSPLEEDEAAIWWAEIEWPHKVPTEVWQFMVQESNRLGVQQLVEDLIKEWGSADDVIFDSVESKLNRTDSPVKYPVPG
jgi:hypothetical protein